jgi:hypothetical protein
MRWKRRTMAPRRPILYPSQYALAILTAVVLVASAAFALWVIFAH